MSQTWPITLWSTPPSTTQTWPITLWDGSPPTTGYIWYDVEVEPYPPDQYATDTEAPFITGGDTVAAFLGQDTVAVFLAGMDTRADFLSPLFTAARFIYRGARADFLIEDTSAIFVPLETSAPFIKIDE